MPIDAGLVVAVSGAVTYKGAAAAATAVPATVTPYMKLRVGDVVSVPVGAHIDALYFASGRKEAWDGEATFVIGEEQGTARSGAPKAADQGSNVGRSLENLPILLRQAESYQAGQTLVRGGPGGPTEVPLDEVELAQVAEARTTYGQLRAAAKPDDVFPELYLVSVLLPLGLEAESQETLEKAVKACPTCQEPKALLEWLKARRGPAVPVAPAGGR